MATDHQLKVERVAAQVQEFYRAKTAFRIFHGSTNSTRTQVFKRSEMLDVSDLNEIISIDAAKGAAIVEPNVPMDVLVKATLQHKLVPPVIPEFPGITVGGGIQGAAGESSSFKWGFLSQTVNWVEYVLGDGSVVKASPDENADLFYGAAGSSGTMGVITAAEIQLIPATKYVQLTYQPIQSFASAIETLQNSAEADYDFIDGIMFGKDHGVIISGKLSDRKEGKLQHFSRAHDPWFYLHAAKIDAKSQAYTETVPLTDYLFRYNRGAFWTGRYAFERFGVPFNALTRFVLNPILNTRKLYQALQNSGAAQEYIVQDLSLPINKTEDFLNYIDTTTAIYPLWLCPIKPEPRSPLLCNGLKTPLVINIGVWGPRMPDYEAFKTLNRDIEANLLALGGKKWLYAHTYYTEPEFWKTYDELWYKKLRQKYKATNLPTIYDKVVVRKQYPVSARRGLFKTITGRAKLRVE